MNTDILFQIAAVGMIVAVLCQLLTKADRTSEALLVGVVGLVIVLFSVVGEITSLFETLRTAFGY